MFWPCLKKKLRWHILSNQRYDIVVWHLRVIIELFEMRKAAAIHTWWCPERGTSSANTRRWANAGLMLVRHRRRWTNIKHHWFTSCVCWEDGELTVINDYCCIHHILGMKMFSLLSVILPNWNQHPSGLCIFLLNYYISKYTGRQNTVDLSFIHLPCTHLFSWRSNENVFH